MGFPVVKESLCGCSLRTGARVIAWLSLLSAILSIVLGVVDMTSIRDYGDEIENDVKTALTALYWFTIIIAILILFATLALLMGIDREQPPYMVPWLCLKIFTFVVALVLNILIISFVQVSIERIGSIIDQIFSAYMILIVFSYQRSLKEEAPSYT